MQWSWVSGELGVSIVMSKTFGANSTRNCVHVSQRRRVQLPIINKCKLLLDFIVHRQQHLHCLWQHSSLFNEV
jgi:hypothetical protein